MKINKTNITTNNNKITNKINMKQQLLKTRKLWNKYEKTY